MLAISGQVKTLVFASVTVSPYLECSRAVNGLSPGWRSFSIGPLRFEVGTALAECTGKDALYYCDGTADE